LAARTAGEGLIDDFRKKLPDVILINQERTGPSSRDSAAKISIVGPAK
jgi:hypothetical protein